MRANLKRAALAGLLAADGLPLPETALIAHLQNSSRPHSATVAEAATVLAELESAGWIAASRDELTQEKTYTLTTKGQHKAQQL